MCVYMAAHAQIGTHMAVALAYVCMHKWAVHACSGALAPTHMHKWAAGTHANRPLAPMRKQAISPHVTLVVVLAHLCMGKWG